MFASVCVCVCAGLPHRTADAAAFGVRNRLQAEFPWILAGSVLQSASTGAVLEGQYTTVFNFTNLSVSEHILTTALFWSIKKNHMYIDKNHILKRLQV